MDEVVAPVPSVPQEPVAPPKAPMSVRKFLDNLSWVALFVLTPLFFIAFLSQNSLPGEILYPVKRGIENTIIAAASVNPTTRAFFNSDLSDRRFTEAEKLLLSQADTAPLNDLVVQVQSTETAIATADLAKQEELTTKVIAQIDSYQAKLTSTDAQIQSSPQPFAQAPTQTQTQTSTSVPITAAPITQPTTQFVTATPQNPQPTSVQTKPTTAASITSIPSQTIPTTPPASVGTPQVEEQKRQVELAVTVTKLKLEMVKKSLEEKSQARGRSSSGRKTEDGNNSSSENKTTH